MKHLSIDIETYSSVDISSGGAYKYALSPDFEILLLSYAADFEEVHLVYLASGEELPTEIMEALTDPSVIKHAYNAAFEWWCLSQMYDGMDPMSWADQWHCTMLHALYCGYPAGLKLTGQALGLSEDQLKSSTGTLLINYFCKPCKPSKANGGRTRNMPQDSPEKWEQFKAYNIQDVYAEMAIEQRLTAFPVPEGVQAGWVTDLSINSFGFMTDREVVDGAIEVSYVKMAELMQRMQDLTGLDNPNSNVQLGKWLIDQGHPLPDLQKGTVADALTWDLPDNIRTVLEIRQEMAKTSVTKYKAMDAAMCSDGRVRGLLQYYGANRTGRWAGRLVQVQNLPRVYLDA